MLSSLVIHEWLYQVFNTQVGQSESKTSLSISRDDLPLGMMLVNNLTYICEGCSIHPNNEIPGTLCSNHKVSP